MDAERVHAAYRRSPDQSGRQRGRRRALANRCRLPGTPRRYRASLRAGTSAEEKQKALAAAGYNARLDAIDTALALGADPNARNAGLSPDATALHNAVCSGSLSAVQKLAEAGVGIDAKDGPYQATPLAWAEYFVREGGADRVEYFLRAGSRPKHYTEIAAYLRSKGRS